MRIKIKPLDEESLKKKKNGAGRRRHLSREDEAEREDDIEDSLAEIYRDSQGNKIDVDRLKIKRRQGFVFWFFNFLVFGLIAVVIAMGFYYYLIYGKGSDSSSASLEIRSPENIAAGEEFSYTIKYYNPEYVALKNVVLRVQYPEKFIYLESSREPNEKNNTWNIGRIEARAGGELEIRGKIIDQIKSSAIILSRLTYVPENFSSEFEKEASRSLTISNIGFEADFEYSDTALVGEPNEIKIIFTPLENNYLPDFLLRLEKDENIEVKSAVAGDGETDEAAGFKLEKIKDSDQALWFVSDLEKEGVLRIVYNVKDKISGSQNLKIFLEESIGGGKYSFSEKELQLEVVKSDLNLVLIMNGSQSDRPVNFGERLDYSLSYINKGEMPMEDVAVSAVLDSDFLDWTKLEDLNRGRERGNIITWTKEEIPALEEVAVNKGGSIDFSIEVLPFKEGDIGKDFQVLAYGEYRVGFNAESATMTPMSVDNRSNTIASPINSDLGFRVEARYFDENNMPVGNGPLPPKVGEKTSLKIYWTATNNLHDLSGVKAETVLPEGIFWDSHNRTSVGTLSYDQSSRRVIWQIGRLPVTVFRADAEFNVSLTPKEEDRNKIMIVLSGATINAKDLNTEADIEKTSAPKTTKLDDDEIANMSSDGVVR